MAVADRLPSAVVEFVNETVDSIEQLELLLMLIESSDRWWDAVTAASELGVEPARAQRDLEHFATRNLLAVNLANDVSYRFDPGSPSLGARAEAFAAADVCGDRDGHRILLLDLLAGQSRSFVSLLRDRVLADEPGMDTPGTPLSHGRERAVRLHAAPARISAGDRRHYRQEPQSINEVRCLVTRLVVLCADRPSG